MEPGPGIWAWDNAPDATTPEAEAALHAIVGDARVVGFGEAVHTGGGWYAAKATLFRHLVTHDGFRALAMETPWLRADLARDYVGSCVGDPREAADSVFPVFADNTLRDLFAWMCAWNQDHPDDPVQFTGFDSQQPAFARDRLRWLAGEAAAPLSACGDDGTGCTEAAQAVEAALAGVDAPWVQEARLLVAGLRADGSTDDRDARDAGMATTFLGFDAQRLRGAKVVVWAHDGHLARDWAHSGQYEFHSLGEHLTTALGDGYVPVSFLGTTVHTNWGAVEPTLRAPKGSVEERLAAGVDAPGALLALAQVPELARGPQPTLIGTLDLPAQFGGIVWLREVRRLEPAIWGGLSVDLAAPGRRGWLVHAPLSKDSLRSGLLQRWQPFTLAEEEWGGRSATLVLRSELDGREAHLTLRARGRDTWVHEEVEPPADVASRTDLAERVGQAVILHGTVSEGGLALTLADGPVSLASRPLPASWEGVGARVVCRATEVGVEACRRPDLELPQR